MKELPLGKLYYEISRHNPLLFQSSQAKRCA